MVSGAAAHLPAAVNLLLLEALFMQFSGVSFTLWPCRLCLLRVFLCTSAATSFPLSKHTGGGDTAPAFSVLRVCLQFTWEVGLPPSPVEFSSLRHSHQLSRSWLLGARPRSRRSLSSPPGLFVYSSRKDSLPPIFGTQCAPPSFPHVFIIIIAYYSVSLLSPVEVGLCRGLCCFGPALSVGEARYR
jgi:hypothetical protein